MLHQTMGIFLEIKTLKINHKIELSLNMFFLPLHSLCVIVFNNSNKNREKKCSKNYWRINISFQKSNGFVVTWVISLIDIAIENLHFI